MHAHFTERVVMLDFIDAGPRKITMTINTVQRTYPRNVVPRRVGAATTLIQDNC